MYIANDHQDMIHIYHLDISKTQFYKHYLYLYFLYMKTVLSEIISKYQIMFFVEVKLHLI